MKTDKIGLGGGCHWCTEAVFQALKGVQNVEQGWISAVGAEDFHEAVVLHFDAKIISLEDLIEVHLFTHNSTSSHSLRAKYRSAVYAFNRGQQAEANTILRLLQKDFKHKLITEVYGFKEFKISAEPYQNYYLKDPGKPFCRTYIAPKLQMLLRRFPKNVLRPSLITGKTAEEQKIKK